MCGRSRQRGHPGMFGPPLAGPRGFGNDFAYGGRHGHHHGGCRPRQQHQTLTGLAIGAIATAIENKNEQRNARAAALSREVSNSNQADAITPASEPRYAYQPADLDGLVRNLSLSPSEKNKPQQRARTAPVPPPVNEDEPPPAYTPTASPMPRAGVIQPQPTTRSTPRLAPEQAPGSVPALKLATPLFQTHVGHSLIVADQHTLSAALAAYHERRCGRKGMVTRARKALSRDLGILEAERLRDLGWERREIRKVVREGQRALRWEVRSLMSR